MSQHIHTVPDKLNRVSNKKKKKKLFASSETGQPKEKKDSRGKTLLRGIILYRICGSFLEVLVQ
jgi:hypothetical protein